MKRTKKKASLCSGHMRCTIFQWLPFSLFNDSKRWMHWEIISFYFWTIVSLCASDIVIKSLVEVKSQAQVYDKSKDKRIEKRKRIWKTDFNSWQICKVFTFCVKAYLFFFFFNVHEERRGKYLKIKGNQRPETIV